MGRRFQNGTDVYDDNWLDKVKDVITKPTYKLTLMSNRKSSGLYKVTVSYENAVEVITVVTEYETKGVTQAVNLAMRDLVTELPSNIKLQVVKTDVKFALDEIIAGERTIARKTKELLAEKKIKLII